MSLGKPLTINISPVKKVFKILLADVFSFRKTNSFVRLPQTATCSAGSVLIVSTPLANMPSMVEACLK